MSLGVLRKLAFDGPITGFLRDPPNLLRQSTQPVTGFHLQFDSAFLRRISERIDRGQWSVQVNAPKTISDAIPTPREVRRLGVAQAVEGMGPKGDRAIGLLLDWPNRCKEMGYPDNAKPVVIVIDYGEKAEHGWLSELPRQYNGFPIRYRFSPPAQGQFAAGSGIYGTDIGTLGGILEDSTSRQPYALTCAHVAGAKGTLVAEVDANGRATGPVGKVAESTLPAPASGACNMHAYPNAGIDAALIELSGLHPIQTSNSLSVSPIVNIDQDDLILFNGHKSGYVRARVAAATIWKEIVISRQSYCFGDLFALGHRQPIYVAQAVSKAGDSGSWILEDQPTSASTRWLGMLIAGDKQQSQSLACYAEHIFEWARASHPDLVLQP